MRIPRPIAGPTARRSGATCTGPISTAASGPPGGTSDRDDAWLKRAADGFKSAGFNSVWGVGWPERFVSKEYTAEQRETLRHAWETFARELDGSPVGWTVGVNFPGVGFDRAATTAAGGSGARRSTSSRRSTSATGMR